MAKKIYIVKYETGVHYYFGTLKKAHGYLLHKNEPVMKHYSEFKKWFFQDGEYQIGAHVLTGLPWAVVISAPVL